MTYINIFWIYLLCDFLEIHQICKAAKAPLIQIQMQGHLLYTILLVNAENFSWWVQGHFSSVAFQLMFTIQATYLIVHALILPLSYWSKLRIKSPVSKPFWLVLNLLQPFTIQVSVSRDSSAHVASPNKNTMKQSQCFPPSPSLMALVGRMQLRPREESARRNKRFWMQSWGLVCWCEFQVLLPL